MELPSIDIAVRKDALSSFAKRMPLADARILESYCHAHRCLKASLHGIPCFAYGDLLLFETDKFEDHVHASQERYNDLVLRSCQGTDWKTAWYSEPKDPAYERFKEEFHTTLARAKSLLSEKSTTTVGLFSCPRCKSQDVDTEQKQTRSADEPMTIFCQCTKCNLRFVR
jgi:DNA-directed RNA polymerase subunit M/transcription elongation factor TFIIS